MALDSLSRHDKTMVLRWGVALVVGVIAIAETWDRASERRLARRAPVAAAQGGARQ